MTKLTRTLLLQAVGRTAWAILFLGLLFFLKKDVSLLIIPGGLSFVVIVFLFVWARFISFEQTPAVYDMGPGAVLTDFESAQKCGRFRTGKECFYGIYAVSVYAIPFSRIHRMYRLEYTREIENRTWRNRLVSRDRHQYHALVILMKDRHKITLWGKKHDIEAALASVKEMHPSIRRGYTEY